MWIIKKDIEFSSWCAHHFLPFYGKVTIGYVPNDKICGLSKLDRIVNHLSKKPQVQEILGDEILSFLDEKLAPKRLVVIIESTHTCVACRGAESRNSSMITTHYYDVSDLKEFKEMVK
jgi:GTP cyclohydrolase I